MHEEIQNDDKNNIALYTGLLNQHGYDVKSLNWGSRQSQEKRFEVLASAGVSDKDSVLDVGCGLADLYAWMKQKGLQVDYTGIDITPEMVSRATAKYPDASFVNGTLLEPGILAGRQFDYVFASGIFYLRKTAPMDYLKTTVGKMWEMCSKGIAFNTLSNWAGFTEKDEFYADPYEVIAFCRTLSGRIIFRHDYHPADFSLIVYK